ncbi:MAG: HIT domain-containing protein [Phytoplasma sp.]|uniref:HIT family protein n=1 Tax=Phytoplasma sp. TaxID=2155 RepID=UPI002B417C8F|nr:HIT domain-containing protein [Phytoplasma sp.]WRH06950.1 MAG: HIT domain-containing protein [Phytoplasma sp.]
MSTIFTKIIKRQIPSYILYEDELVIAFLDISQATKGHTLVVTKEEYKTIDEVPTNVFKHLFEVVHKISKTLITTLNCQGINLINNNGIVSGQTIFHYHIHLLPRFSLEEIKIIFTDNSDKMNSTYYERITKNIVMNLEKQLMIIK